MRRRVGDIEEFAFEPLTQGKQLHVAIAVSGWLNAPDDGTIAISCSSTTLTIGLSDLTSCCCFVRFVLWIQRPLESAEQIERTVLPQMGIKVSCLYIVPWFTLSSPMAPSSCHRAFEFFAFTSCFSALPPCYLKFPRALYIYYNSVTQADACPTSSVMHGRGHEP